MRAGDKRVSVGILDTGIDASNPDIAPNFSRSLSRNFTTDIPEVDGPCEVPSCVDPIGTDDGGHGTHVAGIVAAAANGVGVTGVAPNVTLVELKGLRMNPDLVQFVLTHSAAQHACPDPRLQSLRQRGPAGRVRRAVPRPGLLQRLLRFRHRRRLRRRQLAPLG